MVNTINRQELFQKIKNLNLPFGKYALFGSLPMVARELRDCTDIDIIVKKDLWIELEKTWPKKVSAFSSSYLSRDNIELFKDWKPGEWDIEELIKEADTIEGLPFVKLEKVLEWKKLYGREKDLKDVETIKKYLQS